MASQAKPITNRRAPLSRERVLEAAMGLADESGITSLTMRRLAQELGVEAMTLYYYVSNKDEMLNGMVDIVVGEIELPSPGADWKADLRRTAISAHAVLTRHPWAAALVLSSAGVSDARLRYMNAILGCFRLSGFSADTTDHAYHALESHIIGFTLWVVGMDLGSDEDLAVLATDFLRDLPRDRWPHLAEHVEQHLKPRDPDDEGSFAFGLDLILDGLERIRQTA
ncbi:MAG: TetR/AcrR family transcriptional regulator C-terminal domain-containing protein [Candidatus Limnocylindria bacterium]